MIDITVLMPSYNSEDYIEEAIDSILNQTFFNFELLIIDDGSSDSTVRKIKNYNDSRIRLIENSYNRGLPYVRNLGLKLSRGKYIAFLDSDDICFKNRLELQYNIMEKEPNLVLLGSNFITFNETGQLKSNLLTDSEKIKLHLMFRNAFQTSAIMIRKEIVEQNNIRFNSEFYTCQDYDFWVKMSNFGEVKNLKEQLVLYRKGHSSVTKKSKKNKKDDRKKILFQIRKEAIINNGFDLSDKEIHLINDIQYDDYEKLSEKKFNDYYKVCKKILFYNRNFNKNKIKFILQNNLETALLKKASSKKLLVVFLLTKRVSWNINIILTHINRIRRYALYKE